MENKKGKYGKGGLISVGDNVKIVATGKTMKVTDISKNAKGQVEFKGADGSYLIGDIKKVMAKGGGVGKKKYYAVIVTYNQHTEPYISVKPQTIITNSKEEMLQKLNDLYKKTFSQDYVPYNLTDFDEKSAINGTYISDDWAYVTTNFEDFKNQKNIALSDFNKVSKKYANGGGVGNTSELWENLDDKEKKFFISNMLKKDILDDEDVYIGIEEEDYNDLPEKVKSVFKKYNKMFFNNGGGVGKMPITELGLKKKLQTYLRKKKKNINDEEFKGIMLDASKLYNFKLNSEIGKDYTERIFNSMDGLIYPDNLVTIIIRHLKRINKKELGGGVDGIAKKGTTIKTNKMATNKKLDKLYAAQGPGERTSKKFATIYKKDGTKFRRKNANQYYPDGVPGGEDYTEKRTNRTDKNLYYEDGGLVPPIEYGIGGL